jgi:hypothetical protein
LSGGGDPALRAFGCGVGLSLVGLLWWNARATAGTVPMLSLALVGLDLPFLVYGDSVRGYGLGSAFVLLTYGFLAKALGAPRGRWAPLALATLAAVASVQVVLSNAALLFALCGAAALTAGARRRWGLVAGIFGCGAVAALSLLPYAKPLAEARRQWSFIVVYPGGALRVWHGFTATLGPLRWAWLVLVIVALSSFVRGRRRPRRASLDIGEAPGRADMALFAVWTIPCALVANGAFLALLGYVPRPWYFLPLLGLLGSALDTVWGFLPPAGNRKLGLLAGTAVLLVVLAEGVPLAQGATLPQTNVDRVARQVAQLAAPEDLVIVDPWYYGVSFNRYYRGRAPWRTLPDLPDHRIHRYDLLKARLAAEHPIDDVLAAAAATLRSHHRVWRVGSDAWPAPGEAPPSLPPAPRSPEGWHDRPYAIAWSQQLAAFLKAHATHAADLAIPGGDRANGFEDLTLVVVEGWREGWAPATEGSLGDFSGSHRNRGSAPRPSFRPQNRIAELRLGRPPIIERAGSGLRCLPLAHEARYGILVKAQ